jgi:hypothetical protein
MRDNDEQIVLIWINLIEVIGLFMEEPVKRRKRKYYRWMFH